MKYKALIPLALLVLASFVQFLPSEAIGAWPAPTDFASNFDNFAVGTVNPFPWTYANGATAGSYGNITGSHYRSVPNSYQISLPATTSTPAPKISATFNATQTSVNATVYFETSTTQPSTGTLNACIVVGAAKTCSTSASSGSFAKLSVLAGVTAGSTISVIINASTSVISSGSIIYYFDDFSIIGAAAYTSSQGGPAINFRLLNASSAGPYLFDPTGYAGSTLTVNFPQGTNSSSTWTNAPAGGLSVAAANITGYFGGTHYSFATATLITFWLGSQYSRTLIPSATGKTNMYIDNPASVLAYVVSVIGPAGNSPNDFPSGSQIYIQQGGHNISSGYLDSSQKFSTYLVPGVYTVYLYDSSGGVVATNTQTASFPDVAGSTVTVNVFGAPIKYNAGIVTTQAFGVAWASTTYNSLSITYKDNSGTTSQVGIVIDKTNSSGTYAVFTLYNSTSLTTSQKNFTISMPVNSINLSRNYSSQMYVIFYSTSSYFGTNATVGKQNIPLATCSSCIFPQANINLPGDVLGLSTVFTFVTWTNIIALIILVMSASSFGFLSARFGFLVLALELDFFAAIGWLPLASALVTSLPLLAMTAILVGMNKGK